MAKITQRITPFLWFDDRAEEAAGFYVSIFPNSRIKSVSRYTEEVSKTAGRPKGSVMTVAFELETQEEVDHFWTKLSAGGQEVQCGWLKDKFGLSWQVVPTTLFEFMADKDPA